VRRRGNQREDPCRSREKREGEIASLTNERGVEEEGVVVVGE
jgi:hypothetical protein